MKAAPNSSSIGSISSFAAFALAISCTEGAELDDEGSSGSGAETFDGGSADEGDTEYRTYEGAISNPSFGLPVRTGTTAGKTNEFTPSCGYSTTAPDVSYTWTAPSSGSFVFSTKGSSYDTILHVRSFTNSAQTLGCNDNTLGSLQSSVSLDLSQGTTIIIVVDGYASQAGSFKLNISKGEPCLGGCDNPPVQCMQPNGWCMVDGFTGSAACYYPPKPTGEACDDHNDCSRADTCVGYSCVPYDWKPCVVPPNDCFQTFGTCDWFSEACEYTPKTAGTLCDDGNGCTEGDACDGFGTCVPTDACDPTSENCNGWPGCCDPSDEYCATQEMNVGDPQGFAATPEPPPFEELDADAFMALERQLREQGRR